MIFIFLLLGSSDWCQHGKSMCGATHCSTCVKAKCLQDAVKSPLTGATDTNTHVIFTLQPSSVTVQSADWHSRKLTICDMTSLSLHDTFYFTPHHNYNKGTDLTRRISSIFVGQSFINYNCDFAICPSQLSLNSNCISAPLML